MYAIRSYYARLAAEAASDARRDEVEVVARQAGRTGDRRVDVVRELVRGPHRDAAVVGRSAGRTADSRRAVQPVVHPDHLPGLLRILQLEQGRGLRDRPPGVVHDHRARRDQAGRRQGGRNNFV